MDDLKIPMKIFQTYEELTEYYKDGVEMELGLYVSEGKLLVGHAPTPESFNPQYFTGHNELMPDYVPESPIDYTVTATSNNETYGYVTGGGTYPQHSEITLNAYAYYGYKFDKWSNGVETSAYTFAVEEDADLVGNFIENTFTVTVGVNDTNYGTATGAGTFIADTEVTVTATAETGYRFVNWTENGTEVSTDEEYTFTVTGDRTLVANFEVATANISISANDPTYGSVDAAGSTIIGESYTVMATANTGCIFVNWTENGVEVSTSANYTFTVTADRTLVANFANPALEPFYVKNTTNSAQTLEVKGINSYGTFTIPVTVEYSSDKENWSTLGTTSAGGTLSLNLNAGDKIYLRALTNKWNTFTQGYNIITGVSKIGGNILSLLYGANFIGQTSFPTGYVYGFSEFGYIFSNNTILTDASELLLPATNLNTDCYKYMFKGCTALTVTPELPATTLAQTCYSSMFSGCTSLTAAPTLPATTLAQACYSSMFSGCTSLTAAPTLPATTLVTGCYQSMFYGCTILNYIKCLAETLTDNSLNNWVTNTSSTGTFVKAAGTTWPSGTSGIPTGWTVVEEPVS